MKDINDFISGVKASLEELYGNCKVMGDVLRSEIDDIGVTGVSGMMEVILENGFTDENPYPVLHFHITLVADVPQEVVPQLLISLNSLNYVISTGAYPSFGGFVYLPEFEQVYMGYRMPINVDQLDGELNNVRYYLATITNQLDIFEDFLFYFMESPEILSATDFMNYIESVNDANEIADKADLLEEKINKLQEELLKFEKSMEASEE